jgi:UDP-glucose 4-epimerase
MKILVTGIAGWIGSAVAKLLVQAGHEVVGIDNLSTGTREAVPLGAWLYEVDILNAEAVGEIFWHEEPEVVYHFAGVLSVQEAETDPDKYIRINKEGTRVIAAACDQFKVKQLIFSSTAAVYGPSDTPVAEGHMLQPLGTYGMSKMMAEEHVQEGQTPWTIFRYFNVAGAGQRNSSQNLIKMVALAALGRHNLEIYGDGSAVRDFIHIDDLAEAHVLALGRPKACRQVLNLGCQRPVSVSDVLRTYGRLGVQVPYATKPSRPGDLQYSVANSSKAKRVLGWRPKKPSLETMILDTHIWFDGHHDS